MPAFSMCTATDVAQKIGGTARLIQLIPDGTDPSTYDAVLLARLIREASEDVASRGNVQVEIQTLAAAIAAGTVSEWPVVLVDLTAWLTADRVWDSGTSSQAKPQNLTDRIARIYASDLEQIRRREISIGAPVQYPATNQLSRMVDHDPQRNRFTRTAFRTRGGLA